jgi:hypothetical protein
VTRLRDLHGIRVPSPPASDDARQAQWQRNVGDALNDLPNLSVFSYSTPESNVTSVAPTLGFNHASGVSVLWAKVTGSGNTGWVPLA